MHGVERGIEGWGLDEEEEVIVVSKREEEEDGSRNMLKRDCVVRFNVNGPYCGFFMAKFKKIAPYDPSIKTQVEEQDEEGEGKV